MFFNSLNGVWLNEKSDIFLCPARYTHGGDRYIKMYTRLVEKGVVRPYGGRWSASFLSLAVLLFFTNSWFDLLTGLCGYKAGGHIFGRRLGKIRMDENAKKKSICKHRFFILHCMIPFSLNYYFHYNDNRLAWSVSMLANTASILVGWDVAVGYRHIGLRFHNAIYMWLISVLPGG